VRKRNSGVEVSQAIKSGHFHKAAALVKRAVFPVGRLKREREFLDEVERCRLQELAARRVFDK